METGTPSGGKKKKEVCFWCSVMLAGVFCGGFLSCLWWPRVMWWSAELQQPLEEKRKKMPA